MCGFARDKNKNKSYLVIKLVVMKKVNKSVGSGSFASDADGPAYAGK
jgi:hypothetical protein